MCGIFGLAGKIKSSSVDLCIEGLKRLEYRGYDSAGIAMLNHERIDVLKSCGKVSQLEQKLTHLRETRSFTIAHTRWATHGGIQEVNAHPHIDQEGHFALVHNGIIENFYSLRESLLAKGCQFQSQTDTEVIAKLFETHYQGDLISACGEVLTQLEGTFAFACLHKNHPNTLMVTTRDKPLLVAKEPSTGQILITSDVNALYAGDFEIYRVESHEILLIEEERITLFVNGTQRPLPAFTPFSVQQVSHNKGDYPHFMLKEIHEQPTAIRRTLEGRYDLEHNQILLNLPQTFSYLLQEVKQIYFVACGTSYHAACIGAHFLEEIAKIPTQPFIASEFRYKETLLSKQTLVVAISQSGETADTLGAIKEARQLGAPVLSITNVANSSITRESDYFLMTQAGAEISVCSTKAFTSQLTLLYLLALYTAQERHADLPVNDWIAALRRLPFHVEKVLEQQTNIAAIANKLLPYDKILFLGRQYMYYTALESSLKFKEISYVFSLAYPAGELKHGPLALIDENTLSICLLGHRPTFAKTHSNLQEIQARKGQLFLLFNHDNSPDGLESQASLSIDNPLPDALAPILYAVALQLFAYYFAVAKGHDVDYPKNLAKSVTVE